MDTYADFKDCLIRRLEAEGLDVQLGSFEKENGVIREAVVLSGREGRNLSPVLYTDNLFGLLKEGGKDFEEIVSYVSGTLKADPPAFLAEDLMTKENILKNLVPTVVSKKENEEGRREYLCGDFLDLAIVYRLVVRNNEIGEGLAALSEGMLLDRGILGEGGMDRGQLLTHAVENMRRLYEPKTFSFSGEFWILTHENGWYGAARILDRELLKAMAETIGGSYYILPSSKHELILLPEEKAEDPSRLPGIVREVNRTAVEKEDYLSDSVYFFNCGTGEVTVMEAGETEEVLSNGNENRVS